MQLFGPLVGALAGGNTAVLRPASTSPNCARAAVEISGSTFRPELATCLIGPSTITSKALDAPVDYVFFTGSPKVGRTIMERAAKYLTPVTLELGGKCPAVVDRSADIPLAARRIAWAKLSNAGQICLSVDHVYVHSDIQNALAEALVAEIEARELMAKTALVYLDSLAQESEGDAGLQLELAEAYLKVGDVQGDPWAPNLGHSAAAMQSYRKALELAERVRGDDDSANTALRVVATAYSNLGMLQAEAGDKRGAQEVLRHSGKVAASVAQRTGEL